MKNWISTDFPELTEEERREYEMLKSTCEWLCICCSKPVKPPKVKFSANVQVIEIDKGPFSTQEYKEARQNHRLLERMRFRAEIQKVELALAPIFSPEHRMNYLSKNNLGAWSRH